MAFFCLKTAATSRLHYTKKSQILNFSSLVWISKKDAILIKEIFLKSIGEMNQIVQKSGEESTFLINIDFMEL